MPPTGFDRRRAWLRLAFYVLYCVSCSVASVAVRAAAPAELQMRSKLESIESAIQSAGFSGGERTVVVRGIVTSSHHRIVIEDRTGALELKPLNPERISLGDEVEVSGHMVLGPEPQIDKAHIRRLWGGSMPLPLSITPDQAADGENEFFLVETVAKLVDLAPAGLTGVRLNLRGEHQNFSAILPSDSTAEDLSAKSLGPGATLSLTGILVVNHASGTDPFNLELRSAEDIQLVQPPSWWNGTHMLLLAALAMILILAAIAAVNHVRHARFRAVAEERASIARDLHDTLAQGYAGITLQLEAAQQMVERDPRQVEALLNEALQLVRHSRHESHLSIDILRSLSRNHRLDELVARTVTQARMGTQIPIVQDVTGVPLVLSYTMVNNLFRIVQEALANAIKHSHARRISVRVDYRASGVMVEVRDDGEGFDPLHVPGPGEGHFGLVGIRERCSAINARLELCSNAEGTLVRVKANL